MLKKCVSDDCLVNWRLWHVERTFRVKPPDLMSVRFWDASLLPQLFTVVSVAVHERSPFRALPWILCVAAIDFIQLHHMKQKFPALQCGAPVESDKWKGLTGDSQFFRYVLAFWIGLAFAYTFLIGKILPRT